MFLFILRRFILMIFTMVLVSVFVFIIVEASPGNLARNFLGAYITEEQEAAFLAQMGLDKPLHIRYFHWLVGSDWTARNKIGMPLKCIVTEKGFLEWWVVGEKGALLRWELKEGSLVATAHLPDGTVNKYKDNDRFKPAKGETSYAWVVDKLNRAVCLELGGKKKTTYYDPPTQQWKEFPLTVVEFIPLKKGIIRGDPGKSLVTFRSVGKTLFNRLRNSAIFLSIALIFIMPLALLLGVIAALKEGSLRDRTLSLVGIFFSAIPEFVIGIFLILVFGMWLKVVPAVVIFAEKSPWEEIDMLVLPVMTLTLTTLGYVLRITRASMVEVMNSQYIRTAFLKGIPYWRIVFKHALRNALIAPITVIMMHVNWLLGGLVIIEVVFGYPGLGKYLYNAAIVKDVNALLAGTMVMVGTAVSTQLVADILYTFINPRIRFN